MKGVVCMRHPTSSGFIILYITFNYLQHFRPPVAVAGGVFEGEQNDFT